MAELPIMPFKTDAFLADTSHMSAEELGAYTRVLLVMWRHGGMIPDDDRQLANIAGVPSVRWKKIAETIRRPLTAAGGMLSQKRLTDTWMKVNEKRRKNAECGLSGAANKWRSNPGSDRKNRSTRLSIAREKGQHTKEDWHKLLLVCGNRCAKCGDASAGVVKDHIKPIYQGGSDGIENLQPLCLSCNSGKGPDDTDHRPEGWNRAMEMPAERLADFLKTHGEMPDTKTKTSSNLSSFVTPAREGSDELKEAIRKKKWAP